MNENLEITLIDISDNLSLITEDLEKAFILLEMVCSSHLKTNHVEQHNTSLLLYDYKRISTLVMVATEIILKIKEDYKKEISLLNQFEEAFNCDTDVTAGDKNVTRLQCNTDVTAYNKIVFEKQNGERNSYHALGKDIKS